MSRKTNIFILPLTVLAAIILMWTGCKPDLQPEDSDLIFSKFYGGGMPESSAGFITLPNGDYLIAGSSQSFSNGGWDIFLLKTDPNGNELWRKNYGGLGNEKSAGVLGLDDGGFVIIGKTENLNGQSDIYFLRFNANGDTLWTRTFGELNQDEEGKCVILTKDGGFALLADQTQTGNPPSDLLLIKTDSQGIQEWSNTYGFVGNENGKGLVQDESGNYFLLGTSNRTGEKKMLVSKTDEQGSELWYRNYGPGGEVTASAWQWDPPNLYLSGLVFQNGQSASLLLKLDQSFDQEWIYEGNPGTLATTVGLLPNGNPVIAGVTSGIVPENTNLYTEIIDPSGNPVSGDPFVLGGINSIEIINNLEVHPDGSFTLCGTTDFEDNPMIWLLKTNPDTN